LIYRQGQDGTLRIIKNGIGIEQTFQNHRITFKPDHNYLNKDEALAMYKEMFTIRRLDYKKKQICGFCLYDGQEAVCCSWYGSGNN